VNCRKAQRLYQAVLAAHAGTLLAQQQQRRPAVLPMPGGSTTAAPQLQLRAVIECAVK